MTSVFKIYVLVGATSVMALGTHAHAGFNYDLRLAANGNPTSPSADLHTVVAPAPGVYHLELWAQISGNSNLTDDTFLSGFFSITSGTTGVKLFGSGSALVNPAIPSTWPAAQVQIGALADLNADGIGDWGSLDQTNPTSWNLYQNTAGVVSGGAVGMKLNSTTWEVLVATVDVNAANIGLGGNTTFNVVMPTAGVGSFNYSGIGKSKPVQAGIDSTSNNVVSPAQVTVGSGVLFGASDFLPPPTGPEPSTLLLLGFGSGALMLRRKSTRGNRS